MKLAVYQIDAFTEHPFEGNPAAVIPLSRWLPDGLLQSIAMEINLPETAFFVQTPHQQWEIRWFTPEAEMDLCGHATLASAYVIFMELEPALKKITFLSKSDSLFVSREGDRFSLDFPSRPPAPIPVPPGLEQAIGATILETGLGSRDLICRVESELVVRSLKPDFQKLAQLGYYGVIVTAQGNRVDCVSRCFFPTEGIPEDPVTGSAHCTIVPFWAKRLEKPRIHARQVSRRGGELFCELKEDRVLLSGRAVKVMQGQFLLSEERRRRP